MRNNISKTIVLLFSTVTACYFTAEANDKTEFLKVAPLKNSHHQSEIFTPVPVKTIKQICDKYAKDTVEQINWLSEMKCPKYANTFTFYNIVYSTCMNERPPVVGESPFNIANVSQIIKKRQKDIADCICRPYAENAIEQNKESLRLECGFEQGGRWSSDYSHHYNWCAHGGGNIINNKSWQQFKVAREQNLNKCRLPDPPIDLSPNGGIKDKVIDRLKWEDARKTKPQAALSYQVQLYANGNLLLNREEIRNYSYTKTIPLPYNANVQWQVRGKNQYGYGQWAKASFQVVSGPPEILNFTRVPKKSYYEIGEIIDLTWNVQCFQDCDISLYGGVNGSLFKEHNQPKSGSYTATCLEEDKAYYLIVKSGSDTVRDSESVRPERKQTNIVRYYFIARCNSSSMPCKTFHRDATSESAAMQWAEAEFSDCTVEKVEFSDWKCE